MPSGGRITSSPIRAAPACDTGAMSARFFRAAALIGATLLAVPGAHATQALPSFEAVRASYVSSEARLLDRAGAPLAERRVHFDGRQLEWVRLDTLAPAMKEALLEAEDRRFYQHEGIDWRAFAAAAVQNLWFEHARGASTLTMQLAGLLDPSLRSRGGRRSLEQKWDQALAAQTLEAQWTKPQILEAYLNLAPFRGELRGINAASWALIGKGPGDLGRAGAAVLAALLRAPNAKADKVAWRACELVARIGSPAACDQVREISRQLDPVRLAPRWNEAPHLAARLLRQPGEVLTTTLSRVWQQRMSDALAAAAPARAGVIVLDNATGAVLADVGGLSAQHADAVTQAYPAGPMLWPLLAARSLDGPGVSAATLFDRGAAVSPRWISLRAAMQPGAGLPMAAVMAQIPAESLAHARAQLTGGDPPSEAGPVALDLPRLAALARMLAVDGLWRAPFWRSAAAVPPVAVVSPAAAFIASDLFPVVHAAAVTPARAAWAVGSNATVSVAVWMETGSAALLEVRAWLAQQLARDGQWPPERVVPAGVIRRMVHFAPAVEAPREEWFVKGTAIALSVPPPLRATIVAPLARAIVDARDLSPDGRVMLRASIQDPRLRWRVDGQPVGVGPAVGWAPRAGLRRVELLDDTGTVLDTVDFAVRSAAAR